MAFKNYIGWFTYWSLRGAFAVGNNELYAEAIAARALHYASN